MSLAASSSLFALPRSAAVAAAAGPSSSSAGALLARRAFASSARTRAPYKTSTGQTAILPVFVPKRPGHADCVHDDFTFVDRESAVYFFSPAWRGEGMGVASRATEVALAPTTVRRPSLAPSPLSPFATCRLRRR